MPDKVEVTAIGAGDTTLVVRPRGRFDVDAARVLLRTVSMIASARVPRARVDFGAVQSFTEDALFGVTGCRRLAERLPGRLTVVAAAGPGARMLRRSETIAP